MRVKQASRALKHPRPTRACQKHVCSGALNKHKTTTSLPSSSAPPSINNLIRPVLRTLHLAANRPFRAASEIAVDFVAPQNKRKIHPGRRIIIWREESFLLLAESALRFPGRIGFCPEGSQRTDAAILTDFCVFLAPEWLEIFRCSGWKSNQECECFFSLFVCLFYQERWMKKNAWKQMIFLFNR